MLEDREIACYPDGTPVEMLEAPVKFIGIRKSKSDNRVYLTTLTDTSMLPQSPRDEAGDLILDENGNTILSPASYMREINLPFYVKDKGIKFGIFLKKWEQMCGLCEFVKEVPTAETCPEMPRFFGYQWLAWFKLPPFLKVRIIAPDFYEDDPLLFLTEYDKKRTYDLFIDPAYAGGDNYVPDILP